MAGEIPLAEPSTEDAENALRLILAASKQATEAPSGVIEQHPSVEPVVETATAAESVPSAEPASQAPATEEAVGGTEPVAETTEAAGSDDLASLRARLDGYESQMAKVSQSLQWARDTALRTASERDRYKQVIQQLQNGGQMTAEQLAAMTAPQSEATGWQPANPFAPSAAIPAGNEVAALDIQRFAIDRKMDDAAVQKFAAWLQNPANGLTADDVVEGNVYQSLRLAHAKYEEASQAANSGLATAARTVAQTQKAAARAASTVVATARPAPQKAAPVDISKMSADEMVKRGYVNWALNQIAGERAR